MNQRFGGGGADPNGYKRDSEGNYVLKNAKRSPYEDVGADPNFSGKNFAKKDFKTGEYGNKQSFWGSKEYDRKSYTGDTDGSRFQKDSRLQGQSAREASNTKNFKEDYKTGAYATSDAREAGKTDLAKPSNDLTDNRQKVFEQPEIIDWREQRKMTMEQSKGILGR